MKSGIRSCIELRLDVRYASRYVLVCCYESSAEMNHVLTGSTGSKHAVNKGGALPTVGSC